MNTTLDQPRTDTLPVAITPPDLVDLLENRSDVQVVDVRTPAEYQSVHIPGSHNVPLDMLSNYGNRLAETVDGPMVLVCRSGQRSREAETALQQFGLPNMHVLEGGLSAWESASLPVNRGEQKWSMERQVRGIAGSLALIGGLGGLLLWRPLAALSAGIGGGLLFSALTDTCGMAKMLSKLPYNQGSTCDLDSVFREMRDSRTTLDLTSR